MPSGGESLGIIRHDGEEKCPAEVGEKWNHVWNHTSIDPNITVTCVVKRVKKVKRGKTLLCIDFETTTNQTFNRFLDYYQITRVEYSFQIIM